MCRVKVRAGCGVALVCASRLRIRKAATYRAAVRPRRQLRLPAPQSQVQLPKRIAIAVPVQSTERLFIRDPTIVGVLTGETDFGILDSYPKASLGNHQNLQSPEKTGDILDGNCGHGIQPDELAAQRDTGFFAGLAASRLSGALAQLGAAGNELPIAARLPLPSEDGIFHSVPPPSERQHQNLKVGASSHDALWG